MGCLSASIRRVFSSFQVGVAGGTERRARVTYNKIPVNASVTHTRNIHASVGLICTVALSNDTEMWFCDGWKALWNNRKKILWPEESQ